MQNKQTHHQQTANRVAPGPESRFDLNIIADSFPVIQTWLAEYGDIVRVQPSSRESDSYIVNHPDAIKRVLINNHRNYVKGVGFERVRMLLGHGLITSDGEFWRQQRRMIQPSFHHKVLARMTSVMREANAAMLSDWDARAEAGEHIDITQASSEITLETVLLSIFGDDYQDLQAQGNPFSILTEHGGRDLQFAYRFKQMHSLIGELLDKRRTERRTLLEDRPDFLALLMQARDSQGQPMSRKALLDEIVTLIVAGHETTAMTLNWCWYLLSQNPQVEARFHAEVDSLDVDIPQFEHLHQLHYTRLIIEETLRLYPPVWLLTRKALQNDQLGNYQIPAGSDIFISPYFMHRHTAYWQQAEAFIPERFDPKKSNEVDINRHKHAYLPFSLGPRRCIGDMFATIEMYIHLATMGRRFTLRYIDNGPIKLAPNINLLTEQPITMRLEKR